MSLVELDEGLKELEVDFGVAEVVTEEGGELFETVQTTSCDHVKQFFGGEREGLGCMVHEPWYSEPINSGQVGVG